MFAPMIIDFVCWSRSSFFAGSSRRLLLVTLYRKGIRVLSFARSTAGIAERHAADYASRS